MEDDGKRYGEAAEEEEWREKIHGRKIEILSANYAKFAD